MLADNDEYLWFSEGHGIKPFLAQQQARNLTYLSFLRLQQDKSIA
jgi:hypothetical protein